MHDPANGLRRIFIPGTSVYKGKKRKGAGCYAPAPTTQLPERSSLAGELGGRPARRNDDDSCNLRTIKVRTRDNRRPTALPLPERSSLAGEERGRSARRKDDDSCNLRIPKKSEHGMTVVPLPCAKTGAAEAAIMATMMAITERSAMMRLIDATSFPSQPSWAALSQQRNSPSTGQPGRRRVVFLRIPLPPFPAAASPGSCHGANLSACCLDSLSTS
jgi:hypothetical protein